MTLPLKISTRRALAAAIALIAGLGAALWLQDARHGWPFSRHHQIAGRSIPAARASGPPAPQAGRASRTSIQLDAAKFDRLGVRPEPARLEPLASGARAVATVAADERRISHVHTRVSGWVEQLYVNTTGETVRAGQPLAAIFSQELFASQTEYLTALRRQRETPGSAVLEAARTRLAVLGMTEREIEAIERSGAARRLVTIVAPRSGVVLRRGVTVGTAVDPSTELLTIADLSRVWVLAELPDGGTTVRVGTSATLSFPGSGRPSFSATVEFIYPTLAERTRATRVRFSVANADGTLRPGLYGTASLAATAAREALTVARDAVVDTGESQHVFVRTAGGALEPRVVRLGARVAERIEVLEGLAAGEDVVTAGVFLIDSESRLRASGVGTGHGAHGGAPAATQPRAPAPSPRQEPAESAHAEHGS